MPVTITSTTDTPEDVAAAMGAEIEADEVEETPETEKEIKTPEVKEEEVAPKPELEADDKDEPEEEEEESATTEPVKAKKITGYKKKFMQAQEENRLLMDLLKKQSGPEEEEETVEAKSETASGKPMPKFEDYKDKTDPYQEFSRDMALWAKEEAAAELRAEQSQRDAEASRNADKVAFSDRLREVRGEGKIYADYDQVLEALAEDDLETPALMQGFIMTSRDKSGKSMAADIMYYLATHPEEHKEIAGLPDAQMAVEMGVVKAKAIIETERRIAELTKKPKNTPKTQKSETVTNTDGSTTQVTTKPKPKAPPAPIKPVGKHQAPASGDLATIAESGDFKAYEAKRLASKGFRYK